MNISKSILDLDAAADELLKSQSAKKSEDEDSKEDDAAEEESPAPDEISDDAKNDDESEDSKESDSDESEPKEAAEEKEKAEKSVKKSEEPEAVEKSCGNKIDKCSADGDNKPGSAHSLNKGDETEEDASEAEDSEEDEADTEKSKKMGKSKENPRTADDFKALAKSFSDLRQEMASNQEGTSNAIDVLAKSLKAVMDMNAELKQENENLKKSLDEASSDLNDQFDNIRSMLETISSQPAHLRKSIASSVEIHDRNFDASVNGMADNSFNSLSKSEVLDVLNHELFSGNQDVRPQDIIGYESGAPLRKELQTLVANKIG